MSAALKFCGRTEELEALIARWKLASDIASPSPQFVVVKAERGVGKTRLAVELYRWLSEQADHDGQGYWPDAPYIVGQSIHVNPQENTCNLKVPIPYLWWGLKAGDPGSTEGGGFVGDAIANHDRFLAPHLVTLLIRSKMRNKAVGYLQAIKDVCFDVGLDVAAGLLPYGDALLKLGKLAFKTIPILKGGNADQIEASGRAAAEQKPVSRADAILVDFEKVLNPRSPFFAGIPAVILLDDAQFIKFDPGLAHFTARLIEDAFTQKWPVLIVATHWRRELSSDAQLYDSSLAAILQHARGKVSRDCRPSIAIQADILKADHYSEVDLRPVSDLTAALLDKLPSLTEEQSTALLERAGGNPRFLEQIIALAHLNEDYFEDWNTANPLKEYGFRSLMAEAVDIRNVVFKRLKATPPEVQEAIAFAGSQGVHFAHSLADEIAKAITGRSCRQGLVEAEDPFSVVTGAAEAQSHVGAFAERLFHEVAMILRDKIKTIPNGGKHIDKVFRDILAKRIDAQDFDTKYSEDDRAITLGLAANLFTQEHSKDNRRALTALGRLAKLETKRHSFEAAMEAANRFVTIYVMDLEAAQEIPLEITCECAELLMAGGMIDSATTLLDPLLVRHRELALNNNSDGAQRDLSLALGMVGDAAQARGDHAAAKAAYTEGLNIARALAARLTTPKAQGDLSAFLNRVGDIAEIRGDYIAAELAYKESLEIGRAIAVHLGSAEAQHDLSTCLNKVGYLAQIRGDHAAAEVAHNESLAIRRALAARIRTPEAQRDLLVSLISFGMTSQIYGNYEAAEAVYKESLDIARALAALLGTPQSQRDLSVCLDRVGDMAQIRGDHEATEIAYKESLEITRAMAVRLGSPEAQRDLSTCLNRVGDVAQSRGDHAAAEIAYKESLKIARALAARIGTPQAQRDLLVSLDKVGGAAHISGLHAAAETAYKESLRIARTLASRLRSPEAQRDLFLSLSRIGDMALIRRDHATAKTVYKESLRIARAMAARLTTLEAQNDLSIALDRIGFMALNRGDHAAAETAYKESLDTRRAMATRLCTPQVQESFAEALFFHAEYQLKIGKLTEANSNLQELTALVTKMPTELKIKFEEKCAKLSQLIRNN